MLPCRPASGSMQQHAYYPKHVSAAVSRMRYTLLLIEHYMNRPAAKLAALYAATQPSGAAKACHCTFAILGHRRQRCRFSTGCGAPKHARVEVRVRFVAPLLQRLQQVQVQLCMCRTRQSSCCKWTPVAKCIDASSAS